MKKQKNLVALAFLSIFLISLFSFIACRNPFTSSEEEEDTIPRRMGALTLLLEGQEARTILPQIPAFKAYELVFSAHADLVVNRCFNTLSNHIHLSPGIYNLVVTAFLDYERQEPAAWGELNNLRIQVRRSSTQTIILHPFDPDGSETGTFIWSISFPREVTDARLNISPLSDNASDEIEFRFAGAGGNTPLNHSTQLKSGFYTVLFTLVKPGYQTIEWLEVLHIFQNLESTFTQDFTIDHFNDVTYKVTFVFNDGVTANVVKTFFHGDIITPPVPPQTVMGRLRKGSWYANDRFSERWNPAERIIGSRTLYLRWMSETCSNATIVGTFRGNVTLHDRIDIGEVILQLFSDNTARIKATSFPGYTIIANYLHQSFIGQLRLSNLVLHAYEMGRQVIGGLIRDLPSQVMLPIRQWCMDDGIVLGGILAGHLTAAGNFNFSPEKSFTTVTVLVEYPNASRSGRYVLTEVQFLDIAKPPLTLIGRLHGSSVSKTADILNEPGRNISTRIRVTSYLFDNINNLNTDLGVVADQPALLMAGSRIAESTNNPWRPPNIFNLSIGSGNQQFTVRFPNRLNIRINHANFTNNNPVVSWDPFPGANGYLVFVMMENRDYIPGGNSHPFLPRFYHHTMGTSATINALTINPGDFIIVEVYALDNSGILCSETRRGALFMDSLSIRR